MFILATTVPILSFLTLSSLQFLPLFLIPQQQSFIDYLSTSSTALRKVLKEPQRTEALSRSNFKYREFTYDAEGKESLPNAFYSDPSMKPKK